ncbi:hypothetical protein RintRC_7361 [Richelia intracellularis]|nr:hypothetical protein RintRC_7361 [Richelia intracellularis]
MPFFLILVDLQYGQCTVEHLNSSLYYATPEKLQMLWWLKSGH